MATAPPPPETGGAAAAAGAEGAQPSSREELVELLGEAGRAGTPVRFRGCGTKLGWGAGGVEGASVISTAGLDRLVEHNAGDLTAVIEAGAPLARVQETFAQAGQMLSLDPPCDGATVGGVVATADSGPLRARYGGPRDLVVGMRIALSDGTLVKSGGKVIKNVAGYDLAKLFSGAFGTLGAIVEVSMRLHPTPPATATAFGSSRDPDELGRAARALARSPLEHHGLDLRWASGSGDVLMRFAGAAPRPQAEAAAKVLREEGLGAEIEEDDDAIWEAQRERQRADAVVRVSGLPTQVPAVIRSAARHGGAVVGRASLGLFWVRLERPTAETVEALRRELRPAPCVVLDRPPELDVDPWGPLDPMTLRLMRRVKERFDPAGVCNSGVYLL